MKKIEKLSKIAEKLTNWIFLRIFARELKKNTHGKVKR